MKRLWQFIGSTLLAGTFVLSPAVAAGQGKPAHAPQPGHRATAPRSSGEGATAKDRDTFKGIAKKLGTTPDALESAYQTAKQANPDLTRGQFVAANMVAHNLSEKYPTLTTQAILDGLKSGKSIGQVLHGYGLSAKEAEEAERKADSDVKAAQGEAAEQQPKSP